MSIPKISKGGSAFTYDEERGIRRYADRDDNTIVVSFAPGEAGDIVVSTHEDYPHKCDGTGYVLLPRKVARELAGHLLASVAETDYEHQISVDKGEDNG